MYDAFFGLAHRPFGVAPCEGSVHWTDPHWHDFERLRLALIDGAPLALVLGDTGTGKTTFLRALLRDETLADIFRPAFQTNPTGDGPALLRWILSAFGAEAGAADLDTLLARVETVLADIRAAGRLPLLAIDEAQGLSEAGLEMLDRVAHPDRGHGAAFQVVLAGLPDLEPHLSQTRPSFLSLAEDSVVRLKPMTAAETADYIRTRIAAAGGSAETLLDADAMALIHGQAQGVRRLVNVLCDRCLNAAFVARQPRPDAALVRSVLADWTDPSGADSCVFETPETDRPQAMPRPASRPAPHAARPAGPAPTPTGAYPDASPDAAFADRPGPVPEAGPMAEATAASPPSLPDTIQFHLPSDPAPFPAATAAPMTDRISEEPSPAPLAAPPAAGPVAPASRRGRGGRAIAALAGAGIGLAASLGALALLTGPARDPVAEPGTAEPRLAASGQGAGIGPDGALAPLSDRLTEARAAAGAAEAEARAASRRLDDTRARLAAAESRLAATRTELDAIEARLRAASAEAGTAEIRRDTARSEAARAEAGLAGLRDRIAEAELRLAALTRRIDETGAEPLIGLSATAATRPAAKPPAVTLAAAAVPPVTLHAAPPDPRAAQRLYRQALASTDLLDIAIAYSRAAVNGQARAAYYLGQIYEVGDGVARDLGTARQWYMTASVEVAAARVRLADLPERPADPDRAQAWPLASALSEGVAELVWQGSGPFVVELAAEPGPPSAVFATPLTAARIALPYRPALAWWRVRAGTAAPTEWQPLAPE
ncbi:AAA family ATPase [Rhodovulum kholense]|uniref:Type II secretory pathway predicted ATPase ExeA n=1 Tax=Rhodovulum kholense TaxID=453584 RepID=A0A8E3ASH0_9RHOB|nr:AAA family ATPase [Rhodovulum kholense]PTW52158.1 type II secretory pathway predicted ATPase ExeA [Rhodovulum kholense]